MSRLLSSKLLPLCNTIVTQRPHLGQKGTQYGLRKRTQRTAYRPHDITIHTTSHPNLRLTFRPWYLLWATALCALVAQIQVAYMYHLFLMSPTMEEDVPIATPPSMRDQLNAAQLIVQWLCSLGLYASTSLPDRIHRR